MEQHKIEAYGWWIGPLYGKDLQGGEVERFYAPTLEVAFLQARLHWPTAKGWRCLGAVDANEPECSLHCPEAGEQLTVHSSRVEVQQPVRHEKG
jgi:hypothetical protein